MALQIALNQIMVDFVISFQRVKVNANVKARDMASFANMIQILIRFNNNKYSNKL